MAKHTPPEGPDADRGVIILTASIAGYDGQARMLAYSVAKAATAAMTLPLARDLQSFGIRVMSIAPGPFATPLFETQPTKVKETLLKELVHPKRFGEGSGWVFGLAGTDCGLIWTKPSPHSPQTTLSSSLKFSRTAS